RARVLDPCREPAVPAGGALAPVGADGGRGAGWDLARAGADRAAAEVARGRSAPGRVRRRERTSTSALAASHGRAGSGTPAKSTQSLKNRWLAPSVRSA